MDNRSNEARQSQPNDGQSQQQHPLVRKKRVPKESFFSLILILYRFKANYQFTPEEMHAIKQCDVEALVQRSIPIGTGFGLAAYYAVRGGYLKVIICVLYDGNSDLFVANESFLNALLP